MRLSLGLAIAAILSIGAASAAFADSPPPTGVILPGHPLEILLPPPPGPTYTPDGLPAPGYAYDTPLTLWTEHPLVDGGAVLSFTVIFLVQLLDGTVLFDDERPIVTQTTLLDWTKTGHSYSIPIRVPWSTRVEGVICCDPDQPLGFTIDQWTPDQLRLYLDVGDAGVPTRFWIGAPDMSAVPEPAIWLPMICGFALTGVSLRRRRGLNQLASS